MKLYVFDRAEQKMVQEPVFSERFMKWAYGESLLGRIAERYFFSRPVFARIYGWLQDRRGSCKKVDSFCRQHGISLDEFETETYFSFNHFFIRRFRAGTRPFSKQNDRLTSPCEGRLLAIPNTQDSFKIPVKGQHLTVQELCAQAPHDPDLQKFLSEEKWSALVFRLAPRDYHRFHFPLGGTLVRRWKTGGELRSVHPYSLQRSANKDVYLKNERVISWLRANEGPLALDYFMIEVGAMTVGKIIQTHAGPTFQRGEEKGYFQFGGSTVILLFRSQDIELDEDLKSRSATGIETLVRLGSEIGSLLPWRKDAP